MRALRPPDPYKNKGVRYTGEAAAQEGRQDRRAREASKQWRRDSKNDIRLRIHKRIRRRVKGTAGAAAAGGVPQREAYLRAGDRRRARATRWWRRLDREERGSNGGNVAGAKAIGKLVAERAKDKGIKAVVFDRGGYLYHGRVKALAEAAREAGLEF